MSYRVYIKHDYKPVVRWYPDSPWYLQRPARLLCIGLAVLLGMVLYPALRAGQEPAASVVDAYWQPVETVQLIQREPPPGTRLPSRPFSGNPVSEPAVEVAGHDLAAQPPGFQQVTVQDGDNLSLIFDRLHLSPVTLHKVITSGTDSKLLKRIKPGDLLTFSIDNGELVSLVYEPDLVTALQIERADTGFTSRIVVTELERRYRESSGMIDDSLYLAARHAGLTDNLTMRLVNIYGWDIDFALDIRKGDHFKVIYEEKFKDGRKVADGSILAAEFTNRGRTYRALRYTSPDGVTGYFDENGFSMRKAFLRTPLNFSYISSGFNLNRKHPVLNRIRAHKGVDYAAPTGTPVKAAGDGTVIFAGKKGGYGNLIVLRHGGTYNTAYAHLHRFAKGMKNGTRVEQGDVIGYVGMTGLATGPHLHYEFRVNGVHRDPLKVELPKALKIEEQHLADFKSRTRTLLALLDGNSDTRLAADGTVSKDGLVLALDDSSHTETPVR